MAAQGILGLILAGGSAVRLGGVDKTLLAIGGRPMLSHIVARLRPQVDGLTLSANGDPQRFSTFGLPVIADEGQAGPLAGVLAGMKWAERWTDSRAIVSVAGDTPFFPTDLVARLRAASPDMDGIAVAASARRLHPVFALWPVALRADLAGFLATSPTFSVAAFLDRHRAGTVDFPFDAAAVDPFFNVNTREDLARAEEIASRLQT